MRRLFLLLVFISLQLIAQVARIEPQNFSSVYAFGTVGSFNDNEIAVMGSDGMLPNGTLNVYLFDMTSSVSANGSLTSPELNQKFSGGIEMTNDYLFIGSTSNNTNVTNGGAVYVYKKVNTNWEYLLKIQPTIQSENDFFGSNIVFYENQLFITASGYDTNGNSSVENGGVYVYYLLPNDSFSPIQILSGNSSDYGFGDMLDIENYKLVTTSEGTTSDSVYTYSYGDVMWGLVNSMTMPVFVQNTINVQAANRVSFSNGKLYLYDYTENVPTPMIEGKLIKIYNWSEAQSEWNFLEDFHFVEGDYFEYKVKVKGDNMYLIPMGFYFLQILRKNPAFHYKFNGTTWNYHNTYAGHSDFYNDNFGYFTLAKGNKVLFGNSYESWDNNLASQANGGAYILDNALSTDEFMSQGTVLFPNPTNGLISVASSSELLKIELYDSIGKFIMSQNSNLNCVDLSALHSGIYICKVTNSNGQIEFKKVIKK